MGSEGMPALGCRRPGKRQESLRRVVGCHATPQLLRAADGKFGGVPKIEDRPVLTQVKSTIMAMCATHAHTHTRAQPTALSPLAPRASDLRAVVLARRLGRVLRASVGCGVHATRRLLPKMLCMLPMFAFTGVSMVRLAPSPPTWGSMRIVLVSAATTSTVPAHNPVFQPFCKFSVREIERHTRVPYDVHTSSPRFA